MKREKLFKKFIVSVIICVIFMMNMLPTVGKIVYAVNEDSVEVNVFFVKENQEPSTVCVADINEENLKINFEIKLKNKGYLKDGVLKIDPNSNFKIGDVDGREIKNNEIKLKQITDEETETILLPIKFEKNDEFSADYAKRSNQITFSGIFVDNDAIEHEVERTVNLELTWTEEIQSNISIETIKNLDYRIDENTDGKIVQEKIKITGNENKIPVKNSNLVIDIPQIAGMEVKEVKVEAGKLGYTQGREDYEVEFGEENYRVEDNKLTINVENNAIDGILKESKGEDEYTVTYQYVGKKVNDERIHGNIELTVSTYGEKEEKQTVDVEYDFKESIGNLVQHTIENKETEISKGYLMANNDADNYEIEYARRDVINISRAEEVESIEIVDGEEYFVERGDAHKYETENKEGIRTKYKKTEFSKENLKNILGETGKVEILNMKDEVMATVTLDLEANEEGIYEVEYPEPISKIKIRTSKPVKDGNIAIINTKAIIKLGYSINLIKDFYKLVSEVEGIATYAGNVKDKLETQKNEVIIAQTSSNATIEGKNIELSTTVRNESVNFKIKLNNNDISSDIYQNPVFEVRFPKEIKEVNVRNIDLFYANGELEIANVETLKDKEQQVLRITLKGMQRNYNLNKETNGTIISFDTDIEVDELTGNKADNVEMYYYNEASVKYENEVDWNMILGLKNVSYFHNGESTIGVNFVAPTGLVSAQQTETKDNEKEEKVVSVQQGEQKELIEEDAEAKLATMGITLMNNTGKTLNGVQILGRIPFKGNKDIVTGEDLGTTVDTILDDEIKSKDENLKYKVYYSENGEATTELDKEENKWKESTTYKVGLAKSYLIVLDEGTVVEPNDKLEFTYDYVIPAGLKKGDAFYGTYVTYYREETGEQYTSPADKIGYETEKQAEVEAEIKLKSDVLKELSDAEYEIVLKNKTDVDARDVKVEFKIPDEFSIENVDGNDVQAYRNYKSVTIEVPKIEANSEESIMTRFNIMTFTSEDNNVKINAKVSGENLSKDVNTETENEKIEKTEIKIDDEYYEYLIIAGSEYEQKFKISNETKEEYKNIKITKKMGEAFEYTGCELKSKVAESEKIKEIYNSAKNGKLTDEQKNEIQQLKTEDYNKQLNVTENYDESTKTVTWNIESLKPGEYLEIKYKIFVKIMDNAKAVNTDTISTICELGDGQTVINKQKEIEYNQSKVEINEVNSLDNGYGKENQEVTYIWEIKNNNNYTVTDFEITPKISDNATIKSIRLETPLMKKNYSIDNTGAIYSVLPDNSTSKLIVKAEINGDAEEFISSGVDAKYDGVYKNEEEVFTKLEDKEDKREITGHAFVDKNGDQKLGKEDEILEGIIVELYNSETNKLENTQITDISGRYLFNNLDNGKYYVKFNFDETKYKISQANSGNVTKDKSQIINVNDNYVTDNIVLKENSASNIDLGLVRDNIFDMKVDATVEKMTVQNSYETTEFIPENNKLGKVDIDPKLLSDSKVIIEYKIEVINQGTIEGKVNKLVDYMPKEMEFDSSLNPEWYIESDGNLYTRALQNEIIKPGEKREMTLKLIKNMTEENTGLVYNSIEIANSSNAIGVKDIDSVANNKIEEDDMSTINCIVGIVTGIAVNWVAMVLVLLTISIIIGIVIWRVIDKRRYV